MTDRDFCLWLAVLGAADGGFLPGLLLLVAMVGSIVWGFWRGVQGRDAELFPDGTPLDRLIDRWLARDGEPDGGDPAFGHDAGDGGGAGPDDGARGDSGPARELPPPVEAVDRACGPWAFALLAGAVVTVALAGPPAWEAMLSQGSFGLPPRAANRGLLLFAVLLTGGAEAWRLLRGGRPRPRLALLILFADALLLLPSALDGPGLPGIFPT